MFIRLVYGSSLLISRSLAHQAGDWIVSSPLPTGGRSDMTATTMDLHMDNNHGPILIAGGCVSGNVFLEYDDWSGHDCVKITDELFSFIPGRDDEMGTYTVLLSMPRPRARHSAVDVEGKLWLVGGRDNNGDVVKEIDVYDLETDTWSTPARFESAVSDHASFSVGTSVYTVGGWSSDYSEVLSNVTIFDTADALSADGGVVSTRPAASVLTARGDVHAVVSDGYAYVVGGFPLECKDGPLKSTERYDIAEDIWEETGELRSARGDLALVELNGKIYMIGGEHNNNCNAAKPFSSAFDDVEVLNVDSNTWTKETDIPFERFRFAAAPYPSDGAIYIFGGQKNLNEENTYPVSDEVHALFEDVPQHEHEEEEKEIMGFADSGASASFVDPTIAVIAFVASTCAAFL